MKSRLTFCRPQFIDKGPFTHPALDASLPPPHLTSKILPTFPIIPHMLPTLPYAARNIATGTDEQRRERAGGKWSESAETLNELEYGTNNNSITLPRPLDERVFPSLSAGPENRILMSFECDRRRRTTRLTLNGQALYTFASLYENPSSKAGHFTQLRNKDGKVSHHRSTLCAMPAQSTPVSPVSSSGCRNAYRIIERDKTNGEAR
jgi:hypothetical protein